jgi:hypothetical protein
MMVETDTELEAKVRQIKNQSVSNKSKRVTSSNGKSSSFTRPSSSFTNHTTSSGIRKRKRA